MIEAKSLHVLVPMKLVLFDKMGSHLVKSERTTDSSTLFCCHRATTTTLPNVTTTSLAINNFSNSWKVFDSLFDFRCWFHISMSLKLLQNCRQTLCHEKQTND